MGALRFYIDGNFEGEWFHTDRSIEDLTSSNRGLGGFENWNDEISSIQIESGRWRFFEHVRFQGLFVDLGPGSYPWVPDVGIPDNWISSIQFLGD